jgi:predicted dehydrogenase
MTKQRVRIGIIGGGLMGRELAVVCGRWLQLVDHPVIPEIVAVADPNPAARAWFEQISSVETLTDDWRALVDDPTIDVLYIAVPHNVHEEIYVAAAQAGKDFLAEKPFGIDLDAAHNIMAALDDSSSFVRVSSEMPFFPGALRSYALAKSGALGELVDVRSGFAHSSDLDRSKPINWKRIAEYCGRIGVMGDLGLHVAHVPLRLGYQPRSVYSMLDNIVTSRIDAATSQPVACDTWDNALLAIKAADPQHPGRDFSMLWETRRIAPGNMNTWTFEAMGMDGGVRFSTRNPTSIQRFVKRDGEQVWEDIQPGNVSVWPTVAGGIFEFGFSDALLQMWAAYFAERAGELGDRFGTARPEEALLSHQVFQAALASHETSAAIDL